VLAYGASASAATSKVSPAEKAIANAINLRRSDLPAGFSVSSNAGVTAGGDPGAQFNTCYGPGATQPGGDSPSVSSADFAKDSGGGEGVSLTSGVTFPSPVQLARDTAEARNPRLPQCVADAIAALSLKAGGVKITGSQPHAVRLPDQVKATALVHPLLSMHASLTWTARGVSLPVYMDLYLVSVGHEEIDLFVFATVQPVVISSEGHLLALMVGRALAQPH
jgi:hypothetical protein